MANVYIEARPKGRQEGGPITDYVVEDHADGVLGTPRSLKATTGILDTMRSHLDILVAVVVIGLITEAMASAAGLDFLPSISALLPAQPTEVASPPPATPLRPDAKSWCATKIVVGGFCIVR